MIKEMNFVFFLKPRELPSSLTYLKYISVVHRETVDSGHFKEDLVEGNTY